MGVVMNDEYEWIGISELAKRNNVSKQTCYNWCKQRKFETIRYRRGKMQGLLIKVKR